MIRRAEAAGAARTVRGHARTSPHGRARARRVSDGQIQMAEWPGAGLRPGGAALLTRVPDRPEVRYLLALLLPCGAVAPAAQTAATLLRGLGGAGRRRPGERAPAQPAAGQERGGRHQPVAQSGPRPDEHYRGHQAGPDGAGSVLGAERCRRRPAPRDHVRSLAGPLSRCGSCRRRSTSTAPMRSCNTRCWKSTTATRCSRDAGPVRTVDSARDRSAARPGARCAALRRRSAADQAGAVQPVQQRAGRDPATRTEEPGGDPRRDGVGRRTAGCRWRSRTAGPAS